MLVDQHSMRCVQQLQLFRGIELWSKPHCRTLSLAISWVNSLEVITLDHAVLCAVY